jgi:hypothetical protein
MSAASSIEVRRSVRVRAPRATVLRWLADVAAWPALAPSFRDADVLLTDGARSLTEIVSQHGRRRTGLVTLREVRAPGTLVFEHLNPSSFFRRHDGEWSLTAAGDETELSLVHRIEPRFPGRRILAFVLERILLGPHTAGMLREMADSIARRARTPEEDSR